MTCGNLNGKQKKNKARRDGDHARIEQHFFEFDFAGHFETSVRPHSDIEYGDKSREIKNAFIAEHSVYERNTDITAIRKHDGDAVDTVERFPFRRFRSCKNTRDKSREHVHGRTHEGDNDKLLYFFVVIGSIEYVQQKARGDQIEENFT